MLLNSLPHEDEDPSESAHLTSARRAAAASIQGTLSRLVRLVEQPVLGEKISQDTGITLGGPYSRALTRVVRDAPITTSEISNSLSLDVSTLSRQIGALEKQGLVRRQRKEEDRRVYLLYPTEEGERVFAVLLDQWIKAISTFLSGWSETRLDEFSEHFCEFVQQLDAFTKASKTSSHYGISIRNKEPTC